jgi:hypothetical protein
LKSPTSSFFLVSTEIAGSPAARAALTCAFNRGLAELGTAASGDMVSGRVRLIVLRAIPVIRETDAIPPRPAAHASAAAKRRRLRRS